MRKHSFRDLCGLVAATFPKRTCRTCGGWEYVTLPEDRTGRVMLFHDSGVVARHDNYPCPTCHPEAWRGSTL